MYVTIHDLISFKADAFEWFSFFTEDRRAWCRDTITRKFLNYTIFVLHGDFILRGDLMALINN